MMSKQQTADYAFRFAHFAFELAREEGSRPNFIPARYRSMFEQALALVRHSNHLLAMAEEEPMLNHHDPLAVRDFEANWQQGLNWWNKASEAFANSVGTHTQIRIFRHMEGFRAL
jgi:hypothetical protein